MFNRREMLTWVATASGVRLFGPSFVQGQENGPDIHEEAGKNLESTEKTSLFDRSFVIDSARILSKRPFKSPSTALPESLKALSYENYVTIRNKPQSRIWSAEKCGFVLEPLHRGFIFSTPVILHLVENGQASRLTYRVEDFDFGKISVPDFQEDLGFSGFRILKTTLNIEGEDFAVFQGASFFRALAQGQSFGLMARGLSLKTADSLGEEFPFFREMWIEKPHPLGDKLVIHAILDSESVTGAFQFTLRPGEISLIDIECTLFPRVKIDHIGWGTMTGTFLHGPLDSRPNEDIRPAVYDFTGLQMLTGRGERIWRPAANRETLQISSFLDHNPAGFGCLQMEREFNSFEDDNQHWERRPSLWIEPIGDWGEGAVTLVEIPSTSEINQNVIAYWRPKASLLPESEISFAYRQFWCWTLPISSPLARVIRSRSGRSPGDATKRNRRFLVVFSGEIFSSLQETSALDLNLKTSSGSVLFSRLFLIPSLNLCRVLFDIDPGSEAGCELRLTLDVQNNSITETWLFRWTT